MAVVRDLRVLLRFQGFRRLLGVRLLSQGADGVYQVALAAYVVFSPEKQTSAASIASAMAVLLLPYSWSAPSPGVLLDRWRRRQVLLYGNLLRTALACVTAVPTVSHVPDWLFYASALCVTAVNRFVLAGLSAALPRVVDSHRLVMANALSPTAGTLAATAGGGLAFVVRLVASTGRGGRPPRRDPLSVRRARLAAHRTGTARPRPGVGAAEPAYVPHRHRALVSWPVCAISPSPSGGRRPGRSCR